MNKTFHNISILLCLLAGISSACCQKKKTLFRLLSPSQTGIHFSNTVVEDSLYNVLEYMNIYTGAGVAAGDINNDGLTDVYFSANQGGGKLYLNRGNLKFEDISAKSGLVKDRWETGVSMADVNQDGWLDIYVNVSGSPKYGNLANLLYINNQNGTFSEQAARYRIDDKRQTMHSAFFDYDHDGDLDLFLITNPADQMITGVNVITERKINGEAEGTDILYKNNGDGTFSDVSGAAGILIDGYSLGVGISDINNDGWPDIYVSNDFLTSDILYINNRNGTFTDSSAAYLKHTSFASMGNDISDFNNDGLPDIFVLDMLPEDNFRRKMIMPASSYDKFRLSLLKGYQPQYSRNTLQLNNGDGSFSEIAFLAGVSSTDWSWSSLWGDYDNDGDKDILVTNGFYRDLGNLDYIHYQARFNNPMGRQDAKRAEKLKAIANLPQVPLQNYLFENNGNLTFSKRSDDWGFSELGFSNGACYADLDNDGDLDMVISCFNNTARLYENTASELTGNHHISVRLNGDSLNRNGIGSKVFLHTAGKVQMQEINPYRGFESSMEPVAHFGLGDNSKVDSIVVMWPENKTQVLTEISIDTILMISRSELFESKFIANSNHTVAEVSNEWGLEFVHRENEFVDFKIQPLLPHMHSRNGPGIAVGDINNDGLEDLFIGGAKDQEGCFFLQQQTGKFTRKNFNQNIVSEDMGVLLFDANGDGFNDLYIVSGGSEYRQGAIEQQDRLYLNNTNGGFEYAADALPDTKASGSCVIANDFDKDGDLDLFIGGRVNPGQYPMPAKSYLLRNDGNKNVKFSDVTQAIAPDLTEAGMVTSALWSDFDNDGSVDLVVTGEFMPLKFLRNLNGKFSEVITGVDNATGWWNSIAAADFDEDGDVDYVAGNLGLNSRFKATPAQPLCIYAKDFDKNGLLDPVMCYYVAGHNHIFATRDEMIRQVNPMRGRFSTYKSYANATFEESFSSEEKKGAFTVKAESFETSYFENLGGGKFKIKSMPLPVQFAPIFGILTGDFNGDGFIDVLAAGNSYATEASTGRYDAMKGLLLAGDGKGNFVEDKVHAGGFRADRDVKALAELFLNDGRSLVLVANNDSGMEAYRFASVKGKVITPKNKDAYAIVKKRSGRSVKHEFYYGNNYLSNSTRKFRVQEDVESVTVFDNTGNRRSEKF